MVNNLKNIDINIYQELKSCLLSIFYDYILKNVPFKQQKLNELHKKAIAIKSFDLVSIAISYLAINKYKKGTSYYQTFQLLNDSKYLAVSSNSLLAQKINTFCSSLIEYYEKNYDSALNLLRACLFIKTPEEKALNEAIINFEKILTKVK